MKQLSLMLALLTCLVGCHKEQNTITIAATAVPHADILHQIESDLAEKGVQLKIIEVDDYQLPNRLLAEKKIDANFFQHEPFLEEQNRTLGYDLVPLVKVHIEPLGLYSLKIKSLRDLKEGAIIAIPSDPTNEARSLHLLKQEGLIEFSPDHSDLTLSIHDITSNPKKLKIKEVDAPFIARTLQDVDLAAIPANFALQMDLCPEKDALVLESASSPYVNIVAVRKGEENDPNLMLLAELLHSEKVQIYITQKYCGAIKAAF